MNIYDAKWWIGSSALMLLFACSPSQTSTGRGIGFDDKTQRYSIHTTGATRGELLDQLKDLSQVEVQPQPAREDKLTLDADGLDLDQLLIRLLPANTRFIARRGPHEVASDIPSRDQQKKGVATTLGGTALTKDENHSELIHTGNLKPDANADLPEKAFGLQGPMIKAPARDITVAEKNEPKIPLPVRVPRTSVRVTLEFEEGIAPRVLAVQSIEGGPPVERFVRGPFLFALVDTKGQLLQYGSFEDPLEQHSYLPEGPHSTSRAKSGVAGISLARDNIEEAQLLVIDARTVNLPRELNVELVQNVIEHSKASLDMPAAQLLRALEKGEAQ